MNRRRLYRSFIVLLVLSLLKYLWLAGYAHPVADDFCYAAKSRGMGLWDWSFSEWINWNGRYASNLLMIHGPLTWSNNFLPGYRAIPIQLMALTFLGLWFLLRRLTGHAFSTCQEAVGALVLLLLYLNLMPDLGEGFYWYTGAVTYQLGSILLLFHLALLAGHRKKGRAGASLLLLNVALAAIITGMDEVHMLLMVLFHLARTGWLVRKRPKGIIAELLLLAVVSAGAVLMYLAPGNAVRGAMFADTHELFRSLGMSALQAVRFIGTWLLSPALLAISLIYMPIHGKLKERVPGYEMLMRLPFRLAAVLPFLLVMACTFPAYWATGLLGQHRTVNVACLFFLPLWFLNLSLWTERGFLRKWDLAKIPKKLMGLAMLVALLGLNLTRNGMAVYADLFSGRAANYDRTLLKRESAFRTAAMDPSTTVTITRMKDPQRTLTSYERNGPLREWMADCEARSFVATDGQVEMAAAGSPS